MQQCDEEGHLFDVSNKVVVVIGGGNGIGSGVAKKFAVLKAKVVIVDLDQRAAEAAVEDIRKHGGTAVYICADVSETEKNDQLISQIAKLFDGIDVLVNSAAPSRPRHEKAGELFTLENWDYEMNVLVKAQASLARAALPYLASTKGSIVNFSSIAGRLVTQQSCAYHAGKGAVEQLTRYLAFQFGPMGVRVNAVAPGLVDRDSALSVSDHPERAALIRQLIPLERAATSSDIANVVIFLSTKAGSYITGQSIVTDGGLSLGEQFGVAKKVANLE